MPVERKCGHHGWVLTCPICAEALWEERERLREALKKIQDALNEALSDEVL